MTITAIVPVSPIKSHPDTSILETTIESVRHHLPDAEIILTFDGVRPEQEHRRADYEEFIRRTLWLADHKWGNVCPLVFEDHQHQTGMMRAALEEIKTPLLFYVEHDTPLVTDREIGWDEVRWHTTNGTANLIRFHHEVTIPPEHSHLMHGTYRGLIRTSQWSQRPHVASVAYYRRLMESHFTPESKCFIEDVMHSVLSEAHKLDGIPGWQQHRTFLYAIYPTNLRYTYHLDGRAGEDKFDDTQIF